MAEGSGYGVGHLDLGPPTSSSSPEVTDDNAEKQKSAETAMEEADAAVANGTATPEQKTLIEVAKMVTDGVLEKVNNGGRPEMLEMMDKAINGEKPEDTNEDNNKGPATVKLYTGNDKNGNPIYEDYPYNTPTPEQYTNEDKSKGPATVRVHIGTDRNGNPIFDDKYPYNTAATTEQDTPKPNTEKSFKDMKLDDLTTEWAKARDEKDISLGTSVQNEILKRVLAEKNIPDDHKQALMDRMSAMADAKRKKQDDGTNKEPTPSEKIAEIKMGVKKPDEYISTSEKFVNIPEKENGSTLVYVEGMVNKLEKQLTEAKTDEEKTRISTELADYKDMKERLGSTLLGKTDEAAPKFDDKDYEDISDDDLQAARKEALKNKDSTTGNNIVEEIIRRQTGGASKKPVEPTKPVAKKEPGLYDQTEDVYSIEEDANRNAKTGGKKPELPIKPEALPGVAVPTPEVIEVKKPGEETPEKGNGGVLASVEGKIDDLNKQLTEAKTDEEKANIASKITGYEKVKERLIATATDKTEKTTDTTGNGEKKPEEKNRSVLVYVEGKISELEKQLAEAKTDEEKTKIADELTEFKETKEKLEITLLGKTDEAAPPKYQDKAYEDMDLAELNDLRLKALDNEDSTINYNVVQEMIRKKSGEKPPTDDEKKPGEDDEKDPTGGEKDPKEIKWDGILKVFKSLDFAKELVRLGREQDAKNQKDSKHENSKSWITSIKSIIKHNALFKKNVQGNLEKDMLDALRTEQVNGKITFVSYQKIMNDKFGIIISPKAEEKFMTLAYTAANMEGAPTATEISPEHKDTIKGIALRYSTEISAPGLTDEQKKGITDTYATEMSKANMAYVGKNPNASPIDLELYADGSKEMLISMVATMDHEQAMEEIDKMLAGSKIAIYEGRTGAYNNIDTKFLEKVDRLGKLRNSSNAVLKAAGILATWAASGGAAVALAQLGRSATSIGVGVATGPLAVFAFGVTGSGFFGRYLTRQRTKEVGEMFSADGSGDNGFAIDRKGRKLLKNYTDKDTGLLRSGLTDAEKIEVDEIIEKHSVETMADKMKPKQENMELAVEAYMQFMKRKDGLPDDWNKEDISNYETKANLTPEEKANYAALTVRHKTFLALEKAYNDATSSAKGTEGNSLNVFSAKDYQKERIKLLLCVMAGQAALSSAEFQDTPGIKDVISEAETRSNTEFDTVVKNWHDKLQKEINHAGKVGGFTSAATTAIISGVFAGITELASNGEANTIFDLVNKNHNISPIAPEDLNVIQNSNDTITIDTDAGPVNVPVDPVTGELSQQTITDLHNNLGIDALNKPDSTISVVPGTEYLKNLGGYEVPADTGVKWFGNFTPESNGTELGLQYQVTSDGGIDIIQQAGTASGAAGIAPVDVISQGEKGNIFIRIVDHIKGSSTDTIYMDPDLQMIPNGHGQLVAHISPDSPIFNGFSIDNGAVTSLYENVGSTFVDPATNAMASIATDIGRGGSEMTIETATNAITASSAGQLAKKALTLVFAGLSSPFMKGARDDNMKRPTGTDTQPTSTPTSEQVPSLVSNPKPKPINDDGYSGPQEADSIAYDTSTGRLPDNHTAPTNNHLTDAPYRRKNGSQEIFDRLMHPDKANNTKPPVVEEEPAQQKTGRQEIFDRLMHPKGTNEAKLPTTPEKPIDAPDYDVNTDQGLYDLYIDAAKKAKIYAPEEAPELIRHAQNIADKNSSIKTQKPVDTQTKNANPDNSSPIDSSTALSDPERFKKVMDDRRSLEYKEKLAKEVEKEVAKTKSPEEIEAEIAGLQRQRSSLFANYHGITSPAVAEVDRKIAEDKKALAIATEAAEKKKVEEYQLAEKQRAAQLIDTIKKASANGTLADIKPEDLYAYRKTLLPGSPEEKKVSEVITKRNANYVSQARPKWWPKV